MEALLAVGGTLSSIGSGLSAALPAMSAQTVLQGAATGVSMLSSLGSGAASRQSSKLQSSYYRLAADLQRGETDLARADGELDGTQAEIAGRAAAIRLRDELAETIGGQRVALAASGVDAFSGTARRMAEAAERSTGDDLETVRGETEMAKIRARLKALSTTRSGLSRAAGYDQQARGVSAAGDQAFASAGLDALSTGMNFTLDVLKRGGPTARAR